MTHMFRIHISLPESMISGMALLLGIALIVLVPCLPSLVLQAEIGNVDLEGKFVTHESSSDKWVDWRADGLFPRVSRKTVVYFWQ